jgi:hypothetical protein
MEGLSVISGAKSWIYLHTIKIERITNMTIPTIAVLLNLDLCKPMDSKICMCSGVIICPLLTITCPLLIFIVTGFTESLRCCLSLAVSSQSTRELGLIASDASSATASLCSGGRGSRDARLSYFLSYFSDFLDIVFPDSSLHRLVNKVSCQYFHLLTYSGWGIEKRMQRYIRNRYGKPRL